jgi:RHS repeat-associated protein
MTKGTRDQSYVWGNNLLSASNNMQNATQNNNNFFFYLHDHLGSPIRLLDETDNEPMAYDEFGLPYAEAERNTHCFDNPFGFTGYQVDNVTGMYYAQARFYDPNNRRFLSPDTHWTAYNKIFGDNPTILPDNEAIHQSANLYSYVLNNPIKYVDFTGGMATYMDWYLNPPRSSNEQLYRYFYTVHQHFQNMYEASAIPAIKENIVGFSDPNTNTISESFQRGIFRGSGSITLGYSELQRRLQTNSSNSSRRVIGEFRKISILNATGRVGIGDDNIAISRKSVVDILTGTAHAGLQYKDGYGVGFGARASAASVRATIELNVFGWEIEFGVNGHALSVGADAMAGYFPNEGFAFRAGKSFGLGGGDVLFRLQPNFSSGSSTSNDEQSRFEQENYT